MDFESLLAGITPENLNEKITEISGFYETAMGGADESIRQLNAIIAERDAEILKLKSQNFDLLMLGREAPPADEVEGDEEADDDSADDETEVTVDDLFYDKDEN